MCLMCVHICLMRIVLYIQSLFQRKSNKSLQIPSQKESATTRPTVELIVKESPAITNLAQVANIADTTTTLTQGQFRWASWIYTDTLYTNRRSCVSIYTNTTSKETCVIKTQSVTAQVESEIDCLKRCCHHPNIVRYMAHRVCRGKMELAMAHCPGEELFDYIVAHGPVDLKRVKHVAHKLLETVAYLHNNLNIMHRDIKPENIMYHETTGTCLLIDFGLARVFKKDAKRTSQVGTPFYTPPEIVYGRPYTCTVDEWSTGVTLFMMLYGSPPFYGDTNQEIYKRIRRGVPWSPFEERSTEAAKCIYALLRVNPDIRATATEVLTYPWFDSEDIVQKQ